MVVQGQYANSAVGLDANNMKSGSLFPSKTYRIGVGKINRTLTFSDSSIPIAVCCIIKTWFLGPGHR